MARDDNSHKISQRYDVLSPKSGKAYPIPCDEWTSLKNEIGKLSYQLNIWLELGFAFVGVTLSTLVIIILSSQVTTAASSRTSPSPFSVHWVVVGMSLFVGIVCIVLGCQKENIKKTKAEAIVGQMEMIEKRYQIETPYEEASARQESSKDKLFADEIYSEGKLRS